MASCKRVCLEDMCVMTKNDNRNTKIFKMKISVTF